MASKAGAKSPVAGGKASVKAPDKPKKAAKKPLKFRCLRQPAAPPSLDDAMKALNSEPTAITVPVAITKLQRQLIRQNVDVMRQLYLFWESTAFDIFSATLPREPYINLHVTLASIFDPEKFKPSVALEAANADWILYTQSSGGILSEGRFLDAILDLIISRSGIAHHTLPAVVLLCVEARGVSVLFGRSGSTLGGTLWAPLFHIPSPLLA
jgi:hypothetical protein